MEYRDEKLNDLCTKAKQERQCQEDDHRFSDSGDILMKIQLEWWEIELGAIAGVQRQVENLRKNRQPAYGADRKTDWQKNIEGALGEMAVAKFLNLYWGGKGEFRGDDVGPYQIRTVGESNYRLILHKEDPDDKIFWLAIGRNGSYTIKGWLIAKDGKKKEYWTDPNTGRPAYFVPHDVLNRPEDWSPKEDDWDDIPF